MSPRPSESKMETDRCTPNGEGVLRRQSSTVPAHTPGPWVSNKHRHSHRISGGGCKMLAEVHSYSYGYGPDDATRGANAALIAAAPDLLEVVKLALACEPEDFAIWRDQARAALVKATEG